MFSFSSSIWFGFIISRRLSDDECVKKWSMCVWVERERELEKKELQLKGKMEHEREWEELEKGKTGAFYCCHGPYLQVVLSAHELPFKIICLSSFHSNKFRPFLSVALDSLLFSLSVVFSASTSSTTQNAFRPVFPLHLSFQSENKSGWDFHGSFTSMARHTRHIFFLLQTY